MHIRKKKLLRVHGNNCAVVISAPLTVNEVWFVTSCQQHFSLTFRLFLAWTSGYFWDTEYFWAIRRDLISKKMLKIEIHKFPGMFLTEGPLICLCTLLSALYYLIWTFGMLRNILYCVGYSSFVHLTLNLKVLKVLFMFENDDISILFVFIYIYLTGALEG